MGKEQRLICKRGTTTDEDPQLLRLAASPYKAGQQLHWEDYAQAG